MLTKFLKIQMGFYVTRLEAAYTRIQTLGYQSIFRKIILYSIKIIYLCNMETSNHSNGAKPKSQMSRD